MTNDDMNNKIMEQLSSSSSAKIDQEAIRIMGADEAAAIEWLQAIGESDESIGYAWSILEEYYESCKKELKEIAEQSIKESEGKTPKEQQQYSPFFKQKTQEVDEAEIKEVIKQINGNIIGECIFKKIEEEQDKITEATNKINELQSNDMISEEYRASEMEEAIEQLTEAKKNIAELWKKLQEKKEKAIQSITKKIEEVDSSEKKEKLQKLLDKLTQSSFEYTFKIIEEAKKRLAEVEKRINDLISNDMISEEYRTSEIAKAKEQQKILRLGIERLRREAIELEIFPKIETSDFLSNLFQNIYIPFFNMMGVDLEGDKINIIERLINIINRYENNQPNSIEDQWFLAQIMRLYNMQIKFGHSARVVYIAQYDFDHMMEASKQDSSSERAQLLKTITLTSALLHDVGRFYQAAHFNTFKDAIMSDEEKIARDIEEEGSFDHACAGYYFALASSLVFQSQELETEEARKEFVLNAIVALVVRFHQISNKDMPEFDSIFSITDIMGSGNDFTEELQYVYKYINALYSSSRAMAYETEREIRQEELQFMKQFISRIIGDDMDDDMDDEMDDEMNNGIKENLQYSQANVIQEHNDLTETEPLEISLMISDEQEKKLRERIKDSLSKKIDITLVDDEGFLLDKSKSEITKKLEEAQERIETIVREFRKDVIEGTNHPNEETPLNIDERENDAVERIMKIIRDLSKNLRGKITQDKLKQIEEVSSEEIKQMLHNLQDFDIARAMQADFKAYHSSRPTAAQSFPDAQSSTSGDSTDDKNSILGKTENMEMIHFFMTYPLLITTDADKVDILNQRCLGIYPTSPYKEPSFDIIATPGKSFVELLNEYFCFDIKDPIVLDSNIIKVINSLHKAARIAIENYLVSDCSELACIFDKKQHKIKKEIKEITISENNVIINHAEEGKRSITTEQPYKLFKNKDWNEFLVEKLIENWESRINDLEKDLLKEDISDKEKEQIYLELKDLKTNLKLLNQYNENRYLKVPKELGKFFVISVDRNIFDSNIASKEEEEKIRITKKLIATEWLDRKFQLGSINPNRVWIYPPKQEEIQTQKTTEVEEYMRLFSVEDRMQLESENMHIAGHYITTLIWQLNQFILVNMRSKQTMNFLLEYEMLDKILNQYKSKDPLIAAILEDYIDYCKGFMAYVINRKDKNNVLTGEDMAELRIDFAKEHPLHPNKSEQNTNADEDQVSSGQNRL